MYEYIIYISISRVPTDFVRLANDAAPECNAVRRTLAASLSSSSPDDGDGGGGNDDNDCRVAAIAARAARAMSTLRRINDISNVVCTFIDAAELCRS